jgi:hypothetical protein
MIRTAHHTLFGRSNQGGDGRGMQHEWGETVVDTGNWRGVGDLKHVYRWNYNIKMDLNLLVPELLFF